MGSEEDSSCTEKRADITVDSTLLSAARGSPLISLLTLVVQGKDDNRIPNQQGRFHTITATHSEDMHASGITELQGPSHCSILPS